VAASVKERLQRLVRGTAAEPAARWLWRQWRQSGNPLAHLTREDRWTFAILARVLRPDSACIDVGAADGDILAEMLRLAPAGRHHAVEPLPGPAATLRRAFPMVTVHQLALSDTTGTSSFQHVVSNPGYSGLRRRRYPFADEKVTPITVDVRRLDDLLDPEVRIDCIKIDVEGGELPVMRGAERTLRHWQPHVIFEHGTGASEFYGATPEQVFDLLADCGLRVSLLPDFLADLPSLERAAFVAQFGGEHWYFIAHPA
jgi:FkbM family methyltransferase